MADVFEAEDRELQRAVAVKVLHTQFATDDAFVQRFRREAQAAANLSHPNIVSIFDWGSEASTYFIVMELIHGRTVRDILKSEETLLPRRSAEIIAEVAAALEVAHASGLIHRDLKPGNIMLTADGSVKVTDFGIARALDDSEELTKTGAVIGTATYFSPEQAQGLPADERSDVYSLGIVLYEMLAGIPPFSGESPVAVAYQHVSEFAAPPSSLNHDVPRELDAIVMKALEKNPGARYQSAAEMRNDLLHYLRGEQPAGVEPVAVAPPDAATRLMESPPPATVPPDETARHVAQASAIEEAPHSQSLFILGVAALVVAVGIGAFLLFRVFSGGGDGNIVVIPDVAGLTEEDALAELQALDLRVRTSFQASDEVEPGLVIGTEPPVGERVQADSFVTVLVSTGPEGFPVLNLIGETEERAIQLLADNDLTLGAVECESRTDIDEGIVVSQSPAAGTQVPPQTEVDLIVSCGPESIIVPPLAGLAVGNARFQLIQAGFGPEDITINIEEEFSSEVPEGFVVRSEPDAASLLPKGGSITLFVSAGPGTVQVPLLVGKTVAEAGSILEELGLVLQVDPTPVPVEPGSGLENVIAAQDPQPDVELEMGESVVVAIGQIPRSAVPSLVGLSEADARSAVEVIGLVFEVAGTTPVPDAQVGTVISQTPAAGTELQVGQTVTVILGEPTPTTTTTTTTTPTTTTTIAP